MRKAVSEHKYSVLLAHCVILWIFYIVANLFFQVASISFLVDQYSVHWTKYTFCFLTKSSQQHYVVALFWHTNGTSLILNGQICDGT